MKLLLSKVTLSLIILLSAARIDADNLIWVNATAVPIHVTGEFVNRANSTCRIESLNQQIEPSGVFTHSIPGCFLTKVTVRVGGQVINATIRDGVFYGLFVIRPTRAGTAYELEGPHIQESIFGSLYLVNATGGEMQFYSEYHTLFCSTDRGRLSIGGVRLLPLGACETKLLYGHDIAAAPDGKGRTNNYTGRVGKGTFVFRRKLGSPFEFEVVGPFRQ